MKIKTTGDINTRTQDGREFTAADGSLVDIDNDDPVMVGLAKSLIMSGQAEHYGDAGAVDEEPVEPPAEPAAPDVEDAEDVEDEDLEDDEA